MIAVQIVNLIMVLIPAGSLVAWTVAASRHYEGRPLLNHEPRRLVPWGFVDLILLIAALIAVQLVFVGSARALLGISFTERLSDMSPRYQAGVMTLFSVATFVAWLIGMEWMRWRHDASWHDLGWQRDKAQEDTVVGLVAYLMLITPVFAIQFILTRWMETKHPLIELLRENPDPWFFVFSGFAAVIIAPIVEEYFFRVFLQGWLENVVVVTRAKEPVPRLAESLWRGTATRQFHLTAVDLSEQSEDDVHDLVPVDNPSEEIAVGSQGVPSLDDLQPGRTWFPIVVSAALFAMAHVSHGPDPIPLFFLALGLGYIYQRTHRVLPCIVIHMLVNGVSMFLLWVSVNQPTSG